jgi:protein-histidine pros-kinase
MNGSGRLHAFIALVFLLAGGITAGVAYLSLMRQAASEVARTSSVVMEAALGVRAYTSAQIKPELDPLLEQRFLPQTVPSFAAMQSVGALKDRHSEYRYREAAFNPTNPRDRARGWEEVLIRQFAADPKLTELSGEVHDGGAALHYAARPIRIVDATCLRCHSTPAAAPRTLLAAYGDKGGFGWQMNEVVGAQIVTVPVAVPQQQALLSFRQLMLWLAGLLMLLYAVTVVMVNRLLDE